MGTLYDFAQKTVARPISKFHVKWHMFPPMEGECEDNDDSPLQEVSKRARGEGPPKVTMRTSFTFQCSIDMASDVPEKFESEGYEDLDIKFGPEKRI